MFANMKKAFLTGLLLAACAVVPFGSQAMASGVTPNFGDNAKVEQTARFGVYVGPGWGGGYWGGYGYYRPYYRPYYYYSPYYYNYYYPNYYYW